MNMKQSKLVSESDSLIIELGVYAECGAVLDDNSTLKIPNKIRLELLARTKLAV